MKKYVTLFIVIVIIANYLHAEENDISTIQPSSAKAKKALIITGGALLGTFYVATIICDHAIDNSVNFPQLYIPVIGPFLAIAAYDQKVNPYYYGRTRDKTLLALSGSIQSFSATLMIIGAIIGKDNSRFTKQFENGHEISLSLYAKGASSIGSLLTYTF